MAAGFASGAHSRLPAAARTRCGIAGLGRAGVKGTLYRDTALSSIRLSPVSGGSGQKIQYRAELENIREREQLDRNIMFLCQQHKETLKQLHLETERLRKENRELSFRLIMCRCQASETAANEEDAPTHLSSVTDEQLQLQEEIQRLRKALSDEKCRNKHILFQYSQLYNEREGVGETKSKLVKEDNPDYKTESFMTMAPATKKEEKSLNRTKDTIKLPALKPHLPGGVAERQRRRQIIQRRLSRTLVHPPL